MERTAIPVAILDSLGYREKLHRCPGKIVTRQSMQYIRYYNLFSRGGGFLPSQLAAESGKFLDAVSLIEQAIEEEKDRR